MRVGLTASLLGGAAMLCALGVSLPANAAADPSGQSAKASSGQPDSSAPAPVQVAAATSTDDGYGTIQTAAASADSGGTIETVVVTAEKRSEDSQHVPVALTAIAGSMLDSQGIIGFQELGQRVPSLRFGSGVTGGENVITMRGLGSQNTTPGGDSPVAYSVDGVTLQRTTSVDPEFYDISRIEVLRGPQGTLYGRNSVGGSINVITNHPGDTLGGRSTRWSATIGAHIFRGWVNAPMVDDAAASRSMSA